MQLQWTGMVEVLQHVAQTIIPIHCIKLLYHANNIKVAQCKTGSATIDRVVPQQTS